MDEPGVLPYRPAKPARGVGRHLRRVAGVKEDLLDWVPEERARYARLGAIVLNTGLMAALSLQTALDKVVDTNWLLLLPIALVWGFVIVSFDGWLIASTHGVLGTRARVFLPRLAISILMGAVIAEPMLLWVFQPAIHRNVMDHRQEELKAYESLLRTCNPESGATNPDAVCAGHRLIVGATPAAVQAQLANAIQQRDADQAKVDQISAELGKKQNTARLECNGTPGAGRTGRVGEGPNCERNRAEADEFRRDSRLGQRQADLVTLNRKITELTAQTKSAAQGYAEAVSAAVTEEVAEMRGNQRKIGILDELAALGRLADQSSHVLVAQWLVRLLLIAIDCLPVLTKIMSSTTTYDLLVSRQLETSKRLHDKGIGVAERGDLATDELRMQRTERELRAKLEQLHEADRDGRVRRESDLDAQINSLAEELMHGSDSRDAERRHQAGSPSGPGALR
ncbi:DUF4407 domain-containing protein [Plantactinospora sp. S1510]|uniref:DUF4407 domain-containing protein n=2 Tax=Plantactinospora alkalitolerans TaxID=2789879 RepID=A0ABS0GTF0_9ACTN|nr:DUF4407 domain-containing protein [Plantactinospora alkalitolerans]